MDKSHRYWKWYFFTLSNIYVNPNFLDKNNYSREDLILNSILKNL